MQVCDVMTRDVQCIRPHASLVEAARHMKKLDIGSLPVCGDGDRLVGMLTDRDIVIRAVADNRDLNETKVQDVMTAEVKFCTEDQPVEHAAHLMSECQIRRLIVLNRDRRLVGIVSLGDLALETADDELAGNALEGIAQPTTSRRM